MARTMKLKGTVKMDALVAPNGTVKSVEVRGGHPVLVEAAENAIRKWRWQPAAHETREPIEVTFDPR
jgi:TonB family protein